MTSQTKHFIEIPDIVGIEFKCNRCGISLLVEGEAIATGTDTYSEMLHECPTCKHSWTVPETFPRNLVYDAKVKQFIKMLKEINQLQEHIGCSMRFEIASASVAK